jgi:hypothetical protein
MNIEQVEAKAIDEAVTSWCKIWNVDLTQLTKSYGVDEQGRLTLELSAPLKAPINKVKTKLTIMRAEDEASTGPGTGG